MLIRVIAPADINLLSNPHAKKLKMVNYAGCAISSSCWSEEARYSLLDVMDMHVHIHIHMPVSQSGEAGIKIYRIERERERERQARKKRKDEVESRNNLL